LKYTSPHVGHPAEFGRSRSNGTSVIKEIRLKHLTLVSRLSRSFKVVGTDTTFHSNHGPTRTLSEINGDFSRKSQISHTPCILRPRWRGFPLKLGIGARVSKN